MHGGGGWGDKTIHSLSVALEFDARKCSTVMRLRGTSGQPGLHAWLITNGWSKGVFEAIRSTQHLYFPNAHR